jgi:hypothetical protein
MKLSIDCKYHLGKLIMAAFVFNLVLAGAIIHNAEAKVVLYEEGDKYVEVGGRIQAQYHYQDPDDGDSIDNLFFRRLRPYIAGTIHKDWLGKFQFDYGKAEGENELAIKDAYLQYKGFKNIKISIGNHNFPFSRELLTSSKKQQLVERTFVGDHNYGTPDRNLGVHLTGSAVGKKVTYGVSGASAFIDPDDDKLDFDTPVNRNDDFNEGWMFGGRVDFHPFGYLKMEQGDFKRETLATIGVAAYTWNNDDDNNTAQGASKPDIDSVTGFEISGALRVAGFSFDAEYNLFDAETVDSTITSGMYKEGETELTNWAIEGGYMIVPTKLELVAGYQVQDADNYEDEWNRLSFGLNWFIKKHGIKFQATYRMGENLKGIKDNDEDELFVQAQFVF